MTTALPTSGDVRAAELHALQAAALALRDLLEQTGGTQATLVFDDVVLVCDDDGCHLIPTDGEPVDLSEWIDYTGMVPA